MRAQKRKITILDHDEDELSEEAASSESDYDTVTYISSSKEAVDEEVCHGAGSNQFDIAQYSVDAIDPDATKDEADLGLPSTPV